LRAIVRNSRIDCSSSTTRIVPTRELWHAEGTLRRKASEILVGRGGLIGLAVLALYLWLAPAHVVDGDNAEFATLGALGGRAHPTGYPAFVLWLRAWSWLPGNAAHAAAMATALLGAAQVVALHAACRAWGARAWAATAAVAIYAAGPVAMRTYSEAEVFAGNGLVVALVLWLAAAAGPLRGVARGAALGLVAGVGLANHMTCALVAPVGILGVVRAWRERGPIVGAAAAGGVAAGLLLYVYLYVAPEAASYGRVDSLGDLLDIALRKDYGGPGAFVPHGTFVPIATNLAALFDTLGRAWLWLPGVLGLAMLGVGAVRGAGEPRWGWALLAVSWLVAGPLLVARFNIEPHGLGLYVCQRFHLLPAVLLVVPVAVGFDRAATWIGGRVTLRPLPDALSATLALVGFAALAGLALPRILAVHSPAMEHGVRNALAGVPEGGIVLAVSEDQCFGVRYLQLVEGARPDVDFVCSTLISRAWYRERLARVPLDAQDGGPASVAQAEELLATGRPLLVDNGQPVILAAFPHYPLGLYDRVLPRGSPTPHVGDVIAMNRDIFGRFDLDEPTPSRADDFASIAHLRYALTWAALAKAADAAGDRDAAAFARDLANQLAPTP
jgi:hypothetical protein